MPPLEPTEKRNEMPRIKQVARDNRFDSILTNGGGHRRVLWHDNSILPSRHSFAKLSIGFTSINICCHCIHSLVCFTRVGRNFACVCMPCDADSRPTTRDALKVDILSYSCVEKRSRFVDPAVDTEPIER